jgi:glycosyltransferase involved in cell wall biosynthesis
MRILFLSALDFKEKSIQVIRKTPEAYVRSGCYVKYVVSRDTSRTGDYFYERVIDPPGVDVTRMHFPLTLLRERTRGVLYKMILRLTQWIVILQLAWTGFGEVRRRGPYDIVYGYEAAGVLAAALLRLALRLTCYREPIRYVSRFQGSALQEAVEGRRYFKVALRFDNILAHYLPFDLCVMTNDGTRGLEFLKWVRTRNTNIRYFLNGVDPLNGLKVADRPNWASLGIAESDLVILCVSRLVPWKRIDRSLHAVAEILRTRPQAVDTGRIKLVVVGDGSQRQSLEELARRLGIGAHVVFAGAVPHGQISAFFQRAYCFFTFYELSNVGNPMLEAIRHHQVIFTLANGDTPQWIQSGRNGFIFEADDATLAGQVATAFWRLYGDASLRQTMVEGVEMLEAEKLWTWDERMGAEVRCVKALCAA